jgi:succinate dehydrogenase hydrophobic anchor subunit
MNVPGEESCTRAALKRAPRMPPAVARSKGRNTAVGIVLLLFGGLGFLAAFAHLMLPLVLLREHPGVVLVIFDGLALVLGFVLALFGARAISDDVIEADDAPTIITAIGRAIGLARGKVGDGGTS